MYWFTHLSGVDTRCIGGVALESLEGVEVASGTGNTWIPFVVDVLLGILIPEFVIVLSVFKVKLGRETAVRTGHESGGRSDEGNGNGFGQL